MKRKEKTNRCHLEAMLNSNRAFNVLLVWSQACGAVAVLLVAVWMGYFERGFAWNEDPDKQFNYHPTFMVMGMVFIYGEAIIVYRVFRKETKKFSKTLHVILHSIVSVFMLTALKAVLDYHNYHRDGEGREAPIVNFYSLHSWIGIFLIAMYIGQYIAGFTTFFYPGMPQFYREAMMPFHRLLGVIIFMLVAVTALMGISERAAWKHTCWTKESRMCGQHLTSSLLGVSILAYTIPILILVLNPNWKRQPLPEEENLHVPLAESASTHID